LNGATLLCYGSALHEALVCRSKECHNPGDSISAITFANGGDNIGIYTPLFASSDSAQLGVLLAVFYGMLAVWCGLGYRIARHPLMARALARYGHVLVPFVLMGFTSIRLAEGLSPSKCMNMPGTHAKPPALLEESQCFTYAKDLPEYESTTRSITKELCRDCTPEFNTNCPGICQQTAQQ
jgi:hypothetical protein